MFAIVLSSVQVMAMMARIALPWCSEKIASVRFCDFLTGEAGNVEGSLQTANDSDDLANDFGVGPIAEPQ
jgi:hypothetical protein